MKLERVRIITRNLLLGAAYFTVILQWFWVTVIALPPLIEGGAFDGLVQSSPATKRIETTDPVEITGPTLWLIGGVTAFILILTAIILIKIPKTILSTSESIVHKTTDAVIPIVTNHAVLPVKKRRELSRRLTLAIQLLAATAPAVICLFLPPVNELTREIIITMAVTMVIISVVCFGLAWVIEPLKPTSQTRSRASRG